MGTVSIWITLFLLAPPTQAQMLNQGVVGTSGGYTYQVGTVGAVTNRLTANNLYQQSLQDNASAWTTSPPNFGLLAKAFSESQQGLHSDDQSHSFAQSALGGVNSGDNAGNLDLSKFNSLGVNSLKDLVTTSSPMYPQVESTLNSFGLKMSEDQKFMITPSGAYPTDMTPEQVASTITNVAISMGYSPSAQEINNGVQAGIAQAQRFAEKNQTMVEQTMGGSQGGGGQGVNRSAASVAVSGGQSENSDLSRLTPQELMSRGLNPNLSKDIDKNGVDWAARERQLELYRDKMREAMHVELIGAKEQDIFSMIHERYDSLSDENHFLCEPNGRTAGLNLAGQIFPIK